MTANHPVDDLRNVLIHDIRKWIYGRARHCCRARRHDLRGQPGRGVEQRSSPKARQSARLPLAPRSYRRATIASYAVRWVSDDTMASRDAVTIFLGCPVSMTYTFTCKTPYLRHTRRDREWLC